jgi:hypothetical protein
MLDSLVQSNEQMKTDLKSRIETIEEVLNEIKKQGTNIRKDVEQKAEALENAFDSMRTSVDQSVNQVEAKVLGHIEEMIRSFLARLEEQFVFIQTMTDKIMLEFQTRLLENHGTIIQKMTDVRGGIVTVVRKNTDDITSNMNLLRGALVEMRSATLNEVHSLEKIIENHQSDLLQKSHEKSNELWATVHQFFANDVVKVLQKEREQMELNVSRDMKRLRRTAACGIFLGIMALAAVMVLVKILRIFPLNTIAMP